MSDAPPDPGTVQQVGAAIGVGIVTSVIAAWQWIKGSKESKDEKRKIVLDAFEVADMGPVRDVATVLREAREIVPLIRTMIKMLDEIGPRVIEDTRLLAELHAEVREALRDIDGRLQKMEVEIAVLNRLGGRR